MLVPQPLLFLLMLLGVVALGGGAVLNRTEWLLGARLLELGLLGVLMARDRRVRRELAWRRDVLRAIQVGSARLASAQGVQAVLRIAVDVLGELRVAPHVAFVAYRQGVPHILAARGGFAPHLERPVPATDDSRSVQADHWVSAEVLSLLRPEDRRHTQVLPVCGVTQRHLGLLVLARAGRAWQDEEQELMAFFARFLGAQLGQWQAIHDLRDANDLTLRSLGAALERRDDETGGHTTRVVGLSVRLARALGWGEDRMRCAGERTCTTWASWEFLTVSCTSAAPSTPRNAASFRAIPSRGTIFFRIFTFFRQRRLTWCVTTTNAGTAAATQRACAASRSPRPRGSLPSSTCTTP